MMNFKMPSTITTWLCAAVVTGTAALTFRTSPRLKARRTLVARSCWSRPTARSRATSVTTLPRSSIRRNARVEIEEGLRRIPSPSCTPGPPRGCLHGHGTLARRGTGGRTAGRAGHGGRNAGPFGNRSLGAAGWRHVRAVLPHQHDHRLQHAGGEEGGSAEDLEGLADPKYKGKVTLLRLERPRSDADRKTDPAGHRLARQHQSCDRDAEGTRAERPTYWTSFDQAFNLLNSGET